MSLHFSTNVCKFQLIQKTFHFYKDNSLKIMWYFTNNNRKENNIFLFIYYIDT